MYWCFNMCVTRLNTTSVKKSVRFLERPSMTGEERDDISYTIEAQFYCTKCEANKAQFLKYQMRRK